MSILEKFKQQAHACGVDLSKEQLELIEKFCLLLGDYNKNVNLVSKGDIETLLCEHVLDSLTLLPVIERLSKKPETLVDIGSGAGFPGLILALVIPALKVTLIESIGKKAIFLQQAVEFLKLGVQVEILNQRAEQVAHQKQYRATFQFATARAVGRLGLACELTVPLLKKGGWFLAQKSAAQSALEIANSQKILSELGASLQEIVLLDSSVLGKKNEVMIIEKISDTKDKYPRPTAKLVKYAKCTSS